MKVVGIVAEFNPFHNGHLYLLNKAKEMFDNAIYILIMSGNFTQRAEPSILDKKSKTEIALTAGFDLVVELPFPFATASSEIFATGATCLANSLGVTDLIFGSESNDLTYLLKMVDIELNNSNFDPLVRVYLASGMNYPSARNAAFLDLTNESIKLPNDILASSYIKAIKKNNYKINVHAIKRTNDYNSNVLESDISSASSIRKALAKNENIEDQVPSYVLPYLEKIKDKVLTNEDYFKYIKYKLLTEDNEKEYPSLDRSLINKLKKNINNVSSYDELVNSVKTKNLTYRKVARGLLYYLCNYTKEKRDMMENIHYIRILGLNKKGQNYLNKIKKDCSLPLISKFTREKDEMLELEYKVSLIYCLEHINGNNIINDEFKAFPIRKE